VKKNNALFERKLITCFPEIRVSGATTVLPTVNDMPTTYQQFLEHTAMLPAMHPNLNRGTLPPPPHAILGWTAGPALSTTLPQPLEEVNGKQRTWNRISRSETRGRNYQREKCKNRRKRENEGIDHRSSLEECVRDDTFVLTVVMMITLLIAPPRDGNCFASRLCRVPHRTRSLAPFLRAGARRKGTHTHTRTHGHLHARFRGRTRERRDGSPYLFSTLQLAREG
jgi:hypothetical protein